MKWYNVSTDMITDRSPLFVFYVYLTKKKFYFKVWLLKKIIRSFGKGVMTEIMGTQKVCTSDMFYGRYEYGRPRGKPLV